MAKKIIKKKTSAPKTKARTISVGRPAKPKTVTVLGIEFEQGDNLKFGKCISKTPRIQEPFFFMNIGGGYYILWRFAAGGYVDTYTETEQGFGNHYSIVDFDTPTTQPLNGAPVEDFYEDDDYYEEPDF